MKHITIKSRVNIALVKYWGKLSKNYNIPTNSSLSVTLSSKSVYSKTDLFYSGSFNQNSFTLYDKNGGVFTTELPTTFDIFYNFFKSYNFQHKTLPVDNFLFKMNCTNSFPTQAGMASSASGISCLILAFARMVNFFEEDDISLNHDIIERVDYWFATKQNNKISKVFAIAMLLRVACGSSSRSIFPGLCYLAGPIISKDITFEQSIASKLHEVYKQEINEAVKIMNNHFNIVDKTDDSRKTYEKITSGLLQNQWSPNLLETFHNSCIPFPLNNLEGSNLKNLNGFFTNLCVVNFILDAKVKEIKSKEGMNRTCETSDLFIARVQKVEKTIEAFLNIINDRDYHLFFELLMRESNNFHAVLMDTFPPIFFLNENSKKVIKLIHQLNAENGDNFVGYTFDGGCNPFIFVRKDKVQDFIETCKIRLGMHEMDVYVSDIENFN